MTGHAVNRTSSYHVVFLYSYFASSRGAKYCGQRVCVSVRLSVCLFACALAHIKSHTSKFHRIFATCCLSSDGSAISYVLPVLWMTSCFSHNRANKQNQKRRVYFVEFAMWRHWRRSQPSPNAYRSVQVTA